MNWFGSLLKKVFFWKENIYSLESKFFPFSVDPFVDEIWFKQEVTKVVCIVKSILKTCLCNIDPLKPHVYIVKLVFTGVYIFFLFVLKNIYCGYSLEPPRRGGSHEYLQPMFWVEKWKFIWKFSAFRGDVFSIYLKQACFRNVAEDLPSASCTPAPPPPPPPPQPPTPVPSKEWIL